MPKYVVDIIETDFFGWSTRLEETVSFPTEDAAKAYRDAYNKEEHIPDIEENMMLALVPREVSEAADEENK